MIKRFQDLKKRYKFLKKQTNEQPEEEIFRQIGALNEDLKKFLHEEEFTKLRKQDFLILCCMASSYRPVQPFQFLLKISMQMEAL